MASNILIQGAAQVAQAKHAGALAPAQAATKVAAHLAEGLSEVIQDRNKEFTGIMNSALNNIQGVSNEMYEGLYDKFTKMRAEYVYLNKKDRALMMKGLSEYASGIEANENLKTDLATDLSDEDVVGDTPSDDLGENASDIENIVNGNSQPIVIDGNNGHMIEDPNGDAFKGLTFSEAFAKNRKQQIALHGHDYSKWTNFMWHGSRSDSPDGVLTEYHPFTTDDQSNGAPNTGNKWDGKKWAPNNEIQDKVNDIKVDQNSKQSFEGLLEGVINEASNLNAGDNITFDKDKYAGLIGNNIIENGNLKSLARHKIFGGRSFKKDLKEALRTNTYEELGIPKELVDQLDPTDNGKISRRDARVIWRAIRDDETMLKEYLTGYYTNALEQNFNANINKDAKNSKNENDQQEGVYTDHDKTWDYKVIDGKWHTRRKGTTGRWEVIPPAWTDAHEKLNKKYPNAGVETTSNRRVDLQLDNGFVDQSSIYHPADNMYVDRSTIDLKLKEFEKNLNRPNLKFDLEKILKNNPNIDIDEIRKKLKLPKKDFDFFDPALLESLRNKL